MLCQSLADGIATDVIAIFIIGRCYAKIVADVIATMADVIATLG